MSNESSQSSRSAVASLGRVARLALATLGNRAELFLVEAQEERQRLLQVLLLASILIITATLALVVLTCFIVVIFWEYKVATLAILSLLYVGGAAAAFVKLRRQLHGWQAFHGTIDELQKDREWLKDTL